MKTYLLIFLTSILFTACKKQIIVNFDIKGGKPATEVTIQIPDSSFLISFDTTGRAKCSLVLDKRHFGYGRIIYGFSQVQLFIYEDFNCSVSFKGSKMQPEFSGKGKLLNEHIDFMDIVHQDIYQLDEQEFLAKIAERYTKSLKKLDDIDFPEEFKKTEQIRQKLFDAYVVHNYPSIHASVSNQAVTALSPAYYDFLESYLIDDPAALNNMQSQSRLVATVKQSALTHRKDYADAREQLEIVVNYALEKFADPAVRSFLVNYLVSEYASRYGVAKLGTLKETFDREVTDTEAKRKLEILYVQSQRLQPGAPSPDFTYKDINDKTVSLSSLRGKYVYIDVWATWCPPCCKEIPHVAKLEHKYKGRNIHFVSISVDKNRKAWQKMVREKNMRGIQLNAGKDQNFIELYMISAIPRFILLDPEGHIVNSKMPLPSDSRTIKILDELKGL